ncbi:hypothetical protein [Aquimarina sp. RZ0]|uniref:hypothetical protein n=1 Tax=Aquimarina sp. RZ0 TaxID=2607730 RepID=UPI0011F2C08C|nr:hypothetical protein [Aquimarina sp. RZ0]KAA1246740.1 hypothetical protein F0000_06780 [Aquimarina sp. RZ0]
MLKKIVSLFFLSGFSAIIYQIVWQRVLFTSFGVNIEAITIIVSIFMLGLGIGSLFGGYLSKKFKNRLLFLFILFEIGIGLFGIFSIPIIKYITLVTLHFPTWFLPFTVFMILIIPTIGMGATLPILVTYLYKVSGSVGNSLSQLYYVNTLGSALACLITIWFLFTLFSLSTVTYIAAALNLIIGLLTYLIQKFSQKLTI